MGILLRVIFITQGTSEILDSILKSGHEVIGIVESSPSEEPNFFLKKAGKFITDVHYLFSSHPLNLRLFSKKMKVPYYYFKKRDSKDLERWMKILTPDIVIVFSMSHLLTENVFNIPKFGTVNLHYSYLPDYRGPTPLFWEYYDYVLNPGVTLHYLDKGEDTGDIIYQERIHINSGESSKEVNQKLSNTGSKLILKMMENLEAGNIPRIKQPVSSPTIRARKIKSEEYSGLIRWNEWDVERVFHFLNGTPKYHSSLLKKSRFYRFLFVVKIVDRKKYDISGYEIGSVYRKGSKYFFVCRDGIINFNLKPSIVRFFSLIYPYIS